MKIILLFLLASTVALSQEHTYTPSRLTENTFPGEDGFMDFYLINGTSPQTLDLYNGVDHTLYKSMPIPPDTTTNAPNSIVPGTDHSFKGYYITRHLFNSDDLLEFITTVRYIGNPGPDAYIGTKVVVVNENGVILSEIFDRYFPRIVKVAENTYKLLVSIKVYPSGGYNWNLDPLKIDVYPLPGTMTLAQEQAYLTAPGLIGFPNPTNQNITITNRTAIGKESTLTVYDSAGREVLSRAISADEVDVTFDVSTLSTGTYIYKINGFTGKFIKN